MNAVILEPVEHRWACPSCDTTYVTHQPGVHYPTHPCKGFSGLSTPFVEVFGHELKKNSVRHRVVEREDYIKHEKVFISPDGRPLMALLTERPDGSNDAQIFAPTARGAIES
jgi:hypothetical protein